MNGNLNAKNNVEETSELNNQPKLSKKRLTAYVIGAIILVILTFLFVYQSKKEELTLENLTDVSYELIQTNDSKKDGVKHYEIRIETEEENLEKLNELAYEMATEVRRYEKDDATTATIEVFKKPESGVGVESYTQAEQSKEEQTYVTNPIVKPNLDDKNHQVTIDVTKEIKNYSLIPFPLVEMDIDATSTWEIYEGELVEGHLTTSVALESGLKEEVIYSQLKALESEMMKYNQDKLKEGAISYFEYLKTDHLAYAYSSVYPNALIKIQTILIVEKQ